MDGPSQSHLAPSGPKALALAGLKVFFSWLLYVLCSRWMGSLLLDIAPSQRHRCYESSCMDSSGKQNESMSFQPTV